MDRFAKCFSLCLVVALAVSSLLLIESAKAQIEQVPTYCDILVDDIVEGQPVTVTIQMSPATPTDEGYTQLIVYLKSPNGVGPSSPNGPWVYTNIPTNPNGRATVTFNVPTYTGKWYVFVNFGGHTYADYSMFYLGGTWQKEFTVNPVKTPTPAVTATPTAAITPSPIVSEFPITASLITILAAISLLLVIGKRKLTVTNH
jgi:hypothetical protein